MKRMKKLRTAQEGIGSIELVIALVVVAVICGIGYFVYYSSHHTKNNKSASATTKPVATQPKLKLASKPYEDPKTGISFPYPEGWQVQTGQEEGTIVSFVPSVGLTDNAAIKVLIDDATNRTLENYTDSFRNGLAAQATNYKLISDIPVKAKDGTSLRILTTSFDRDGFNLTSMDAIGVVGDKAIVFDAHANTDKWSTYKDVFLQAALE
jgi:hypothetical protein